MSEAALKDKSINRGFLFISFGAFFIMLSLATHLPAYPHMIAEFNSDAGLRSVDATWLGYRIDRFPAIARMDWRFVRIKDRDLDWRDLYGHRFIACSILVFILGTCSWVVL